MNNLLLKDKVALITGGNGGLGLGMARALVRQGCKIIISGRDSDKNRNALTEIRRASSSSYAFKYDALSKDSVLALVDFTVKTFGKIDILINNAGITKRSAEPQLMSDLDWHSVMDTNLTSVHLLTSAVFPFMRHQKQGKIINIGSMFSIFGSGYSAAYSASKGAIVQYTKSCAVAWAKYNIQVNAILPGWISTDMTDSLKISDPERYDHITSRIPAQRWGDSDDVSGAAVYLSSDLSNYVSGAAIPIDGGYSVY